MFYIVLEANGRNVGAQNGNCHAVAGSNATNVYINIYVAISQKTHYMYIYIPIGIYTYNALFLGKKGVSYNE